MLQRAASNAYSWWWASHIRTKQSKWLEQSVQDMDERVQDMLKLIEGDGDSFAKRAEMYYKRRPELIHSVEEAYKQFKAMADRYDHLSKELQNANHTIATVFPEQVQFALSEDEDGPNTKFPQIPAVNDANVPKVPKAPIKDLKDIISRASKQYGRKMSSRGNKVEVKSGLTEEEALEEISKLQKDILALQTVKEFVKSSYESGISKYLGIENQIMEMQDKVSKLQDEFNMGSVIEDDEARTLMVVAALRSCQETLAMLEEKQQESSKEAKEEYKRIEAAYQRLQALRRKYCQELGDDEGVKVGDDSQNLSKDVADLLKETSDIEEGKGEESLDFSSISSLTVSQLAEKIDFIVNKVITLETAVSSQTVLVNTLRSETDDLNAQIQNLEQENESLIDESQNLSTRVKQVEEKLNKVQDLNKSVDSKNSNLKTNFAQTRTNLDQLSEKITTVKADEDEPEAEATLDHALEKLRSLRADDESEQREVKDDKDEQGLVAESQDIKDVKEVDVDVQESDSSLGKQQVKKGIRKTGSFLDMKPTEHDYSDHAESQEGDEEELDWHRMLLNGMEDGEKILLREYTAILRHYKEVKKRLGELEKKEWESQFDTTLQMRDLKKAIQKRDEEILSLRQRLNALDSSIESEPSNEASEDTEKSPIDMDPPSMSRVEEKLRSDIDSILDENLDLWFRFSTAFHEVQKFKNEVKDLQNELSKLKEKRKADTSEMKSEVLPIYKHLREIQRELTVWSEKSVPLKDDLNNRFASLCSIQEGITTALKEGVEEDEIKFSSHQAAKLQGEILNMKQENDKVREELQAGLDQVSILQLQIEKTLKKVNEEFGISSDQPENTNRNRIPLRSFLFGTKLKKPKNSIFTFMHPSKRNQILRASMHPSNHTTSS